MLAVASHAPAAALAPQDFAYGMRLTVSGSEALYELPLLDEAYRGALGQALTANECNSGEPQEAQIKPCSSRKTRTESEVPGKEPAYAARGLCTNLGAEEGKPARCNAWRYNEFMSQCYKRCCHCIQRTVSLQNL